VHNEGLQLVQTRLCHDQMTLTLVWCWAVLFVVKLRFYEGVILFCQDGQNKLHCLSCKPHSPNGRPHSPNGRPHSPNGRPHSPNGRPLPEQHKPPFTPWQTSPQRKQTSPWCRAVPRVFCSCLVSPVDADI